ncbi:hypothetical protein CHX26_11890 [Porphyrobacter sp. HT-58-2]|nr:hypothetical protein CHX26_11890 [Porphyrobacter sp. HT-58-2]
MRALSLAHPQPLPQAGGELCVPMAQLLSAVEVRELEDCVGSLGGQGEAVLGALDFLVTGVEAAEAPNTGDCSAIGNLEAGGRQLGS